MDAVIRAMSSRSWHLPARQEGDRGHSHAPLIHKGSQERCAALALQFASLAIGTIFIDYNTGCEVIGGLHSN
ncbi:MAG: hypothetical protein V2I26_20225 [Halieaceae bacterium]|jgi:hypothetical protein|nr:hypothetical protein [Halieaceae bacterium]